MESYDRDILPVDSDRDSSINGSISDNDDDDDSIDSCPDYSNELENFTSNYGLWRYLVRVNNRNNFANESRIMTILTIAGAWGGQRHVWTFHEHPLKHFYIYNPSKVPSSRDLTYPSAVWFSDAIVSFLETLWANYEHHMNRIIDSLPTLCDKCETRTCWRVIPHVELSDFTNRPILESWAHFTRRDTPRMLNFIVQMARSSLLTKCECSSCRAEIVKNAAAVRCNSTITTTTYNGDDKSLFIPDEVTFDCDFVARRMYKSERQLEKMRDEIQTWHIGNIGCVIRWLLAEGCIDSHRYIEEIDETFSRLFRIGCIGLAVPFGMYASRRCVVSAVRRFVNTHQEMTSRSCYNNDDVRWPCKDTICSCLRGVTSVKTITALHMLAVARNVTLPPLCRYANIVNRGRLCYARVYVETVMNCNDDTLLGRSVSPAEATGSTDLSTLALRSIFTNFGVNGTYRLTPQFALSPVRKTLFEKATRHRVLLICNRLFVRIFLQDTDSFLWGDSLLLGHCNPCCPNRPIGNPYHISRFYELSDVSREHFFSRLRRQYPPR